MGLWGKPTLVTSDASVVLDTGPPSKHLASSLLPWNLEWEGLLTGGWQGQNLGLCSCVCCFCSQAQQKKTATHLFSHLLILNISINIAGAKESVEICLQLGALGAGPPAGSRHSAPFTRQHLLPCLMQRLHQSQCEVTGRNPQIRLWASEPTLSGPVTLSKSLHFQGDHLQNE